MRNLINHAQPRYLSFLFHTQRTYLSAGSSVSMLSMQSKMFFEGLNTPKYVLILTTIYLCSYWYICTASRASCADTHESRQHTSAYVSIQYVLVLHDPHVYIYIYMCVYIYIYTYIHTYIHTYIYIHACVCVGVCIIYLLIYYLSISIHIYNMYRAG